MSKRLSKKEQEGYEIALQEYCWIVDWEDVCERALFTLRESQAEVERLAKSEAHWIGIAGDYSEIITSLRFTLAEREKELSRFTSEREGYYDTCQKYREIIARLERELAETQKAIGEKWVMETENGDFCCFCGIAIIIDKDDVFIHPTPSDCIVTRSQGGPG